MSELQTHECWVYDYGCRAEMVSKSEVDKLVAELEENHKKEVGQLLILNREQAVNANRLRDSMEQVIRHHAYKRCLAVAKRCFTKANYHFYLARAGEDSKENLRKDAHYTKWRKRWISIAEQFKEAK